MPMFVFPFFGSFPFCSVVHLDFAKLNMSPGQLCVWYSINAPDRVTLHESLGEIVGIRRTKKKKKEGG